MKSCDDGGEHGIGIAEFAEQEFAALAIGFTAFAPDCLDAGHICQDGIGHGNGFWWPPQIHWARIAQSLEAAVHFAGY